MVKSVLSIDKGPEDFNPERPPELDSPALVNPVRAFGAGIGSFALNNPIVKAASKQVIMARSAFDNSPVLGDEERQKFKQLFGEELPENVRTQTANTLAGVLQARNHWDALVGRANKSYLGKVSSWAGYATGELGEFGLGNLLIPGLGAVPRLGGLAAAKAGEAISKSFATTVGDFAAGAKTNQLASMLESSSLARFSANRAKTALTAGGEFAGFEAATSSLDAIGEAIDDDFNALRSLNRISTAANFGFKFGALLGGVPSSILNLMARKNVSQAARKKIKDIITNHRPFSRRGQNVAKEEALTQTYNGSEINPMPHLEGDHAEQAKVMRSRLQEVFDEHNANKQLDEVLELPEMADALNEEINAREDQIAKNPESIRDVNLFQQELSGLRLLQRHLGGDIELTQSQADQIFQTMRDKGFKEPEAFLEPGFPEDFDTIHDELPKESVDQMTRKLTNVHSGVRNWRNQGNLLQFSDVITGPVNNVIDELLEEDGLQKATNRMNEQVDQAFNDRLQKHEADKKQAKAENRPIRIQKPKDKQGIKDSINGIVKDIDNKIKKDNEAENLDMGEVRQFAKDLIDRKIHELKQKRVRNATNIRASHALIKHFDNIRADKRVKDPVGRALKSYVGSSVINFENSRISTNIKMAQAKKDALIAIDQALNREGGGTLMTEEHELEWTREFMNARTNQQSNTIIGRAAKKLIDEAEKNRKMARQLGHDQKELTDRAGPNIHDPRTMLKLTNEQRRIADETGISYTEMSFRNWSSDIVAHIDLERSMQFSPLDHEKPRDVNKFLRGAFDTITNKNKKVGDGQKVLARFEAHRLFHWKSPEDLIAYNKKWGSGHTVMDNMIEDIIRNRQMLALERDWGSNWQETLTHFMAHVRKNHPDLVTALKESDLQAVQGMLKTLRGSPKDYQAWWTDIVANIQQSQVALKLGGITWTLLNDMPPLSAEFRRHGVPAAEGISNTFKNLKRNLGDKEFEKFSNLFNVAAETRNGTLNRFFHMEQTNARGANRITHDLAQLTMKATFTIDYDLANQTSVGQTIARWLGDVADLNFDQLSKADQLRLRNYGIKKEEFDVLKRGTRIKNGNRFFAPDLIRAVEDDAIKPILLRDKKEITPNNITETRNDIAHRLRLYLQDRQELAINKPDAIDRSMLDGTFFGAKPGSLASSVIRMFTQFMAYPTSFIRKSLGETFLEGSDAASIGEAIRSGQGNWRALFQLMGESMIIRYASQVAKALALGQTPPDIRKPDVIKDAASEALPFVTGIFDITDPFQVARNLEPPSLDTVVKATKLGTRTIGAAFGFYQLNDVNKALFSFVHSNPSFLNLFYLQWITQHALFIPWQEYADPAGFKRKLTNLKKRKGQELIGVSPLK